MARQTTKLVSLQQVLLLLSFTLILIMLMKKVPIKYWQQGRMAQLIF